MRTMNIDSRRLRFPAKTPVARLPETRERVGDRHRLVVVVVVVCEGPRELSLLSMRENNHEAIRSIEHRCFESRR